MFALFALSATVSLSYGQGPGVIPVHSSMERCFAVVPLIGTGTVQDPIRPMFVPANGLTSARIAGREALGIISYSYQMSDDGKSALVEFVSTNREGLREILESRAAGVQVFEQGRSSKTEVETVFKARKRDFDFSKFQNKVR